jgi:hypothetical protein
MDLPIAYEDAVDLLDADHKAVKKMFIDHAAMCDVAAPSRAKRELAQRICQALTVHAQLEEEIFYPAVREAIGDDALMDEALHEHAEAKALIARIGSLSADDAAHGTAVKQLGKVIDQHVLEEREQIFLRARQSAMDLRGLTAPLAKRQKQLPCPQCPCGRKNATCGNDFSRLRAPVGPDQQVLAEVIQRVDVVAADGSLLRLQHRTHLADEHLVAKPLRLAHVLRGSRPFDSERRPLLRRVKHVRRRCRAGLPASSGTCRRVQLHGRVRIS